MSRPVGREQSPPIGATCEDTPETSSDQLKHLSSIPIDDGSFSSSGGAVAELAEPESVDDNDANGGVR